METQAPTPNIPITEKIKSPSSNITTRHEIGCGDMIEWVVGECMPSMPTVFSLGARSFDEYRSEDFSMAYCCVEAVKCWWPEGEPLNNAKKKTE